MEIFFAVNETYCRQLCVVLVSLAENNRDDCLNIHIVTSGFSEMARGRVEKICRHYPNMSVVWHKPDMARFEQLELNISYISRETYFRYVLADLAPELDKALYLDADIVINGSLAPLWNMPLADNYCIGAEDLWIKHKGYKQIVGFGENDLYINAGVLLLNLKKIRKDDMVQRLFENTKKFENKVAYQDQDVINMTFKGHIGAADSIYNFTSANVKYEADKIKRAIVFHYTGGVKPWHEKYKNKAKKYWQKYARLEDKLQGRKIKIGLIVDEFFGGAGTAYGEYGFLARRFITKYIPNEDMQIDVLLGKGKKRFRSECTCVDNVNLYRLPRSRLFARRWLKKQDYDVYISIELVNDFVLCLEKDMSKKLILWIQDPRPKYEWDEIATVKLFPESCYYKQHIYDTVHRWYEEGRVRFVSQGFFLNQKAIDLYNLPINVPIQYLPNPVEIDESFDVTQAQKKNQIVFLGRIESVKRGWLFCEIAQRMPEYEFVVLGQAFRDKEKNSTIMERYYSIPNLHFAGHVDGDVKARYLKEAKILVNTSIHEALPISFLEALSYGVLLVSNRNPENLTARFGVWTGDVLGDGFNKIDLYVAAIKEIMGNEIKRLQVAEEAIAYVRSVHNVAGFVHSLRKVIYEESRREIL